MRSGLYVAIPGNFIKRIVIMMNKTSYAIVAVVVIIIGIGGYYLWMSSQPPIEELLDIVDTAVEAGSFTTLVTAVEAADLVDALKGEGPFTVFAPTDDAFDALPEGVLDGLLANTTALADVLTYHVVAGKYMAADVVALTSLTTLQGSDLMIDTTDGVTIDGANIVQTDIECSNGVIHVIDAVMIPGE
jgi:transforming growth factor-beta-induced protein